MKCTECCYYWQDEDESRPRCHFEARCAGDLAPCEYADWGEDAWEADEDDYFEPDDEMGFDPYEGCYTWDC